MQLGIVIRIVSAAAIACAGAGYSPHVLSAPAAAGADAQVSAAQREARILAAFARDAGLRGYDLGVIVAGDRAALSGVVAGDAAKDLAERTALSTGGVDHVDNRIAIDARALPHDARGAATRDAAISAAIESKLFCNALVQGLDIQVATHAGRVTLAGSAISYAERDMAAIVARDTDGVVAVDNELALADGRHALARKGRRDDPAGDPPSDRWITSKVKSSLLYTRGFGRTAFAVTTNHGVVRISGVVTSKADRDLALQVAQDVRGVRQVDADGLTAG